MKKLLALALAIVMMMAIALPTFAATGESATHKYGDATGAPAANSTQEADTVLVEYGVSQTYTISIPADVNFGYVDDTTHLAGALTTTRVIGASDVVIAGDEELTITIDSANDWKLVDFYTKSDDVDYSVAVGSKTFDEDYTSDDYSVLVIESATGNEGTDPDNDATATLTFTTGGTAQEGLFQDTLTFTVTIAAA